MTQRTDRLRGLVLRALPRLRDEDGSALMAAFWMLVVLLLVGLATSYSTSTEVQLAGNERLNTQLFYLAEAGVAQVKRHLDGLGVPLTGTGDDGTEPVLVFHNEPIGAPGAVSGFFTAYVDPQARQEGKPTKFLAITVRAWIGDNPMTKIVQELVGQENFAKYSYFTDAEIPPSGMTIWFTSGDVLRGPVHSNSQFNINGDPIFMKEVTTTAGSLNLAGGSNPDFREGIEYNVDPIRLPASTALLRAKAQESDGLYISSSATLELGYDPVTEFSYVDVDQGSGVTRYQLPQNGVIHVDGAAYLEGTLRGQLTIATSGDLYLTDDIIYVTDPRIDPTSDDLLGLVSEQNIIVDDTAANLDSGDETFMCVMMALNTSFTVDRYNQGTPRGSLRVIGGIIQQYRGPVGTFGGGGISTGYEKDYAYDSRLADNPPPSFPTTGIITTLSWKEMDPSYDISSNVF